MNSEQLLHLAGMFLIAPAVLVGAPFFAVLFHRRCRGGARRYLLVLFNLSAGLLVLTAASLVFARPPGWDYALLFMCAFALNTIGVAAVWARTISVRILLFGLAVIVVVLVAGLVPPLSLLHLAMTKTGRLLRNYASFSGAVALGITVLFLVVSTVNARGSSSKEAHSLTER